MSVLSQRSFVRTLWGDRASRGVGIALILIAAVAWTCYLDIGPLPFDDLMRYVQLWAMIAGLLSLVVLLAQSRAEVVWRRLLSYHTYFQDKPPTERLEKLRNLAETKGFLDCLKEVKEMPRAAAMSILQDENASFTVCKYLDDFEMLSAAIHARIVDPEYAYHLEGTRVIRAFIVFKPMIREFRHENEYTRCYLELERLADTWCERRRKETQKRNNTQGVPEAT